MAENDYYEVINPPIAHQRARAEIMEAEMLSVETGFSELPSKNEIAGGLVVIASEAATSAADAYVLKSDVYPITSYERGTTVRFFVQHTNTGPSTANLDGVGLKAVVAIDGSALSGGELVASWPADLVYDGTRLRLMNSAKAITAGISLDRALAPLTFEVDSQITPVTLPAATGGAAPYTYAVSTLSPGLSFDSAANAREISGTPTVIGSTTVTYTVTDNNATSFEFQFTIRVVPVLLALQKPTDRTLPVGEEQQFTLPRATGGTEPYTYEASGFPDGIVFDPGNREVSGTPTRPGIFSVSYSVTDTGTPAQSVNTAFTITIRTSAVLALPDPPDRRFVPNVKISAFTLPPATGGLQPYTYIVTGLAPGLSFDADSREVSGTPNRTGTYTATYRVVDSAEDGSSVDQTFDIAVAVAGSRYIAVLQSSDVAAVSASELQSGNSYAADTQSLILPSWSGLRRIVIGQPSTQPDLTSISLSGLGNSISDFTKQSYTVTVGGVTYEIWVGNEDQGDVISGETIIVRP